MSEDTQPAAPAPPAPAAAPVPAPVDLDAGEGFGAISIPLKRPFKVAGKTWAALVMRVPTGGEVAAGLRGESPEQEYEALAESQCDLPAGTLKKIFAGDRRAALDTLGKLLAGDLSGS